MVRRSTPLKYISYRSRDYFFAIEEVDSIGDNCCSYRGDKSHKGNDGRSEMHSLMLKDLDSDLERFKD